MEDGPLPPAEQSLPFLEIEDGSNPRQNQGILNFMIDSTTAASIKPEIGKVQRSEVLSKLKTFLPKLKEANEEIAKKPKEDIIIDCPQDSEAERIELDLYLGLLEDEEKREHPISLTPEDESHLQLNKPLEPVNSIEELVDSLSRHNKKEWVKEIDQ